MLSNRTANFNSKEEEEELKINDQKFYQKQFTTPLPKFDIHFKFSNEEEKEMSSFSFKNYLLDKKAYEFIKTKDECLAKMELDDSLPNNEDNIFHEKDNNKDIKEN